MSLKKTVVASVAGLSLIAGFEGYKALSYTPVPGDKLTVGFGHTAGVKPGDRVTLTQATHMLEADVAVAESAVAKYVKVPLEQHQIDALVSFVYNVGVSNFASSTLLKCINSGNDGCVSDQWVKWKYCNGKVLPGLARRRQVELAVFKGKKVWWLNDQSICAAGVGCVPASSLAVERPSGLAGGETETQGAAGREGATG